MNILQHSEHFLRQKMIHLRVPEVKGPCPGRPEVTGLYAVQWCHQAPGQWFPCSGVIRSPLPPEDWN